MIIHCRYTLNSFSQSTKPNHSFHAAITNKNKGPQNYF